MKTARKTGRKTNLAVMHRSKHDTKPRHKPGKLADDPDMKELARMVEAGEVDRSRTLAYLQDGKATINGRIYNPKTSEFLANHASASRDDELYQKRNGEFFLLRETTFLDGRELDPDEEAPDLFDYRNAKGQGVIDPESVGGERRRRLRLEKKIVPLTRHEALRWCIKTLPECFRRTLLKSLLGAGHGRTLWARATTPTSWLGADGDSAG